MAFVLDASATLPWCFLDEATPASTILEARAVNEERLFVPPHWPAEILNAMTRAVRRGRLDEDRVVGFLDSLAGYLIVVDTQSVVKQWGEAHHLIRKHRLSAYDAAYLALAMRLNVELATLDEQLKLAAVAEGVPLAI